MRVTGYIRTLRNYWKQKMTISLIYVQDEVEEVVEYVRKYFSMQVSVRKLGTNYGLFQMLQNGQTSYCFASSCAVSHFPMRD